VPYYCVTFQLKSNDSCSVQASMSSTCYQGTMQAVSPATQLFIKVSVLWLKSSAMLYHWPDLHHIPPFWHRSPMWHTDKKNSTRNTCLCHPSVARTHSWGGKMEHSQRWVNYGRELPRDEYHCFQSPQWPQVSLYIHLV